ncbi:MAG: DUF502 domain-containing protein [Planctomycetes bacterium]|nr:DUF502 domain-containing protein [Planctomycetota bacterium]
MVLHREHPIARTFLRGIALLLPIALTAALLTWLWQQLSDRVLGHIMDGVDWAAGLMGLAPLSHTVSLIISIVLVVLIIFMVGIWFSGFIGRRLYRLLERLLARVPVVSAIYPHIKQISDFFFGEERKIEFRGVVAVEYPRKGVYSIGFLTGSSSRTLNKAVGEEYITIFIPSSPMPVTGYTILVPADSIIDLPLTVDEALRTVISGGLLMPDGERASLSPETLERFAKKAARAAPEAEDALRLDL